MFVDKELEEIDKMIYFNGKNKTDKKITSKSEYPVFTS